MKRFYKQVDVQPADGGWEVLLDGRPVRTPARSPLIVPTEGLAQAIAEEWRSQGNRIDILRMPLTRLAATAIDRVAPQREEVVAEIAAYAESDMLCFRVGFPSDLADRQEAAWQPLLDWAAMRYDAPLESTTAIAPCAQPEAALRALRTAVAEHDAMTLAALHSATVDSGSVVIALALVEGRLSAEEAWAVSLLDETWQNEQWGEDSEAVARRETLRSDIGAAATFMKLCRA